MKFILILFVVLYFNACSSGPDSEYPVVVIQTGMGDIQIEVYPEKAPKTVSAFLKFVDEGAYNPSSFYRVIKSQEMPTDFNTGILQGGIYPSEKKHPNIEHESTLQSGLSHTSGIVSMARTDPGTASTEFFICIGDQSPLDYGRKGTPDSLGMAAFGKVIQGMEVVKKIHNLESKGDSFNSPVIIKRIKRR